MAEGEGRVLKTYGRRYAGLSYRLLRLLLPVAGREQELCSSIRQTQKNALGISGEGIS